MYIKLKNKKISIFLYYYLIFLVIMGIVFSVNYRMVYDTIFNQVTRDCYADIRNGSENIDSQLKQIEESINMLNEYKETKSISILKDISVIDVITLNKYHSTLKSIIAHQDIIANYYVIFNNSGIIFDSQRIYRNVEELYDTFLLYSNMDKEKFVNEVLNYDSILKEKSNVTLNGKNKEVITLVSSSKKINNFNITTVVLLDLDRIKKILGVDSKYEDSALSISIDGRSLYEDAKINNNKLSKSNINMEYKSDYFDLQYKLSVPRSFIISLLSSLIYKYTIILLLLAIVGVIVLTLFYIKTTTPYYKIKKEMDMQEPVIKNYYVNKILNPISSDSEVIEISKKLDISNDSLGFICIFENESFENSNSDIFIYDIVNTLTSKFSNKLILNFMMKTDNQILLIFKNFVDLEDYELGVNEVIEIIKNLEKKYNSNVNIGIGNPYVGLRGYNISFSEAKKVIEYNKENVTNRIISYSRLPITNKTFILDNEEENKLQMLILSGQQEEAINTFKEIYGRCYKKEFVVNDKSNSNFICHVSTILMKAANSVISNEEYKEEILKSISQLIEIKEHTKLNNKVIKIIEDICLVVAHKKQNNNRNLVDDIILYLHNNYYDYNLSLTLLSEKFNMNERYMSQFFKQNTGSNFSQYLELIRMKKAAELLKNRNISINEIYEKVGYGNRNTFYKAFIRIYGINPSAYRESLEISSN